MSIADILEIALGGIVTAGGLFFVGGIAVGIVDNWLHPGSHECPICRGVGCRHCGGGDVDDTELHAAFDDAAFDDAEFDDDEFEGDEWDRARDRELDRDLDREVA